MAIRYVDLVNGNDANNGTTFALRKKTISSASTGLTGGDTVRIMKSDDPTSLGSCTWSNSTRTVILPTAATAHINTCEGTTGWTASANVTITAATGQGDVKYGTNATQIAVAAGFTTGKIAYAPCATVDLSGYQQISMMFRISNGAPSPNVIYFDLCSDSTGTTPVHSFALPGFAGTCNYTIPLTFDNNAALSNNINSIAFRAVSDPGTMTIIVDHIIACKDKTSSDSITLNSLIGFNSIEYPEWYPIQSINDTTVTIATYYNWHGQAGSFTTYKLQPLLLQNLMTTLPNTTTTNSGVVLSSASGNANNYLNFEFGWDTTDMSTQTGFTVIDYQTNNGAGACSGGDYLNINKIINVRPYYVFSQTSAYTRLKFGEMHSISPFRYSLSAGFLSTVTIEFDKIYITCNNSASNSISGPANMTGNTYLVNHWNVNTNPQDNAISASVFNVNTFISNSSSSTGLFYFNGTIANIGSLVGKFSAITTTKGILSANSIVRIKTASISNHGYNFSTVNAGSNISIESFVGTPYYAMYDFGTLSGGNKFFIQNYNNTGTATGLDVALKYDTESTIVHSSGGISWKVTVPNSAYYRPASGTEYYKFQQLKVADIPIKANKLHTVKLWVRRAFTTTKCALFVKPEVSGISDYAVAESSAAANTWEELTITFTPTVNSVVPIYFGAQYDAANASQAFYFDDLSVTIAD